MVFESLFISLTESIINQFLGDYVEGYQKDKLQLNVFSGNVTLSDLRVKKDIGEKFGLPFSMKLGIIKNFELNYTYTTISSEPISMKLDQLYLVVTPMDESDWKIKDLMSQDYKLRRVEEYVKRYLEKATETFSQKFLNQNQIIDDENANGSYFNFQGYLKRISDNIQIEITNIHIRIEDQQERFIQSFDMNSNQLKSHKTYEQMCMGVALRKISLKTIDMDKTKLIFNNDDLEDSAFEEEFSTQKQTEGLLTEELLGEEESKEKIESLDKTLENAP